jgi:flagellar motor protein MotB
MDEELIDRSLISGDEHHPITPNITVTGNTGSNNLHTSQHIHNWSLGMLCSNHF